MLLNLNLLRKCPLLLHRSSHPSGGIRHSDGFLCSLYLISIEQMTQKIFKNFFAMDFKEFFSRHAAKLTPISPISWLYTAIRKAGVNMGELDKSVQTLGTDILGSSFGTNLTSAQREANAFSAAQAAENRQFTKEMSDTTYQRTVEDMKAAGLNPAVMLAGGANGVSTPSGSTATSAVPSAGMTMSDLLGLIMLPSQIANINANTAKINAETSGEIPAKIQQLLASAGQMKSSAENLDLDSEQKSIVLKYFDKQQQFYTASLGLSNDKMQQEINESVARVQNLSERNRKIVQEIAESQQRVNVLLAQESLTRAQTDEVWHLIDKIDAETENIKKYTELTQKDIDWYTANHVVDMATGAVGAIGSVVGGVGKLVGSAVAKGTRGLAGYHRSANSF